MSDNPSPPRLLVPLIHRGTLWACVLATLGVFAIDYFTANLNLSILYTIPLVLCVLLSPRRIPWWLLTLTVALTFMGYFAKPPDGIDPADWEGRLKHLRMVNRCLVAGVIVILGMISGRFASLRQLMEPAPRGATIDADDEVSRILQHLLVTLSCLVMMAGVFISDFLTPPRINVPILYAVPIMLSIRALSRRLLWELTPFAVVLPFVSFFWDLQEIPADRRMWSFINRLIAAAAVLCIAVALDYWLRTVRAARKNGAAHGDG